MLSLEGNVREVQCLWPDMTDVTLMSFPGQGGAIVRE